MLMPAFVFQTLAVRRPDLDAGVYAYTKAGFGEYLGFFSAFGYLKSYDGREKTLLREATADVLPKSVYDRVKSPYPSTQDPKYAVALQDHAKDLLTRPSHPVFDLLDREKLRQAAHRSAPISTQAGRRGLERALDLALWLDLYKPAISLA